MEQIIYILKSTGTVGVDLSFCAATNNLWIFVGYIINILKIAAPIVIVLFASIDLGKAVIAGKEDDIKVAQKLLIKRLIYGVLIFFVVTIVQTLLVLIPTKSGGNVSSETTNSGCWKCAVAPKSCSPTKWETN